MKKAIKDYKNLYERGGCFLSLKQQVINNIKKEKKDKLDFSCCLTEAYFNKIDPKGYLKKHTYKSFHFVGTLKKLMEQLLFNTGFGFYVKDGNLEIYNKGRLERTETYVLNTDTGLLKIEETKAFNGEIAYSVKTIFLPLLRAGEVIEVKTKNDNKYRLFVVNLSVTGNNYKSGFTTDILAVELGGEYTGEFADENKQDDF